MKTLLFTISLFLSGCSCCSNDAIQYQELPPIVKINERYIPIPEILIDGATTPLVQEDDFLTFNDVFTDSATGKKIEVSGVIPKKNFDYGPVIDDDAVHVGHIIMSFRVPKDSVKVQDTSKTVTLKAIPKEKGLMERFFENVYYVASFVLAIITLLIIYTVVKK